MEYEVEGSRGRPRRTWREVVEKYGQVHKLKEDAKDCSRWRKFLKDV